MSDMQRPPYEPNRSMQPPPQPGPPVVVRVADRGAERVLAAASHAAIAFGLFGITFFVSLIITGIIWLYSKRSPHVRFHSEQAGCYQCSVLLINFVLVIILLASGFGSILAAIRGESDWGLGGAALVVFILGLVWYVGTIIFGLVGAVLVFMGKRFKYPIIGDRFERDQGSGARGQ